MHESLIDGYWLVLWALVAGTEDIDHDPECRAIDDKTEAIRAETDLEFKDIANFQLLIQTAGAGEIGNSPSSIDQVNDGGRLA